MTLAKQLLERDLNSLRKTVEDYKKSENERKNHGIQQEKQLQKLQLLLQQVNGELRESTLQTQAVRKGLLRGVALSIYLKTNGLGFT